MPLFPCVFFSRKYGLSDDTVDFIGHALALHRDDRYLNEPAIDTVKRMKVSLVCSLLLSVSSAHILPFHFHLLNTFRLH